MIQISTQSSTNSFKNYQTYAILKIKSQDIKSFHVRFVTVNSFQTVQSEENVSEFYTNFI